MANAVPCTRPYAAPPRTSVRRVAPFAGQVRAAQSCGVEHVQNDERDRDSAAVTCSCSAVTRRPATSRRARVRSRQQAARNENSEEQRVSVVAQAPPRRRHDRRTTNDFHGTRRSNASPAAPWASVIATAAARGDPTAYPSAPVIPATTSRASSARLVRRPARRTSVGTPRVCAAVTLGARAPIRWRGGSLAPRPRNQSWGRRRSAVEVDPPRARSLTQ